MLQIHREEVDDGLGRLPNLDGMAKQTPRTNKQREASH